MYIAFANNNLNLDVWKNGLIAGINTFQKLCIALVNLKRVVSSSPFLDITSYGFKIRKPGYRVSILCPSQLVSVRLFPTLGNMYGIR